MSALTAAAVAVTVLSVASSGVPSRQPQPKTGKYHGKAVTLDAAVAGAPWAPSPMKTPAKPKPLVLTAGKFPAAGKADVTIGAPAGTVTKATASQLLTRAAGTPVLIGPAASDAAAASSLAATGDAAAGSTTPAKVTVSVADHAAATAAGVTGVVVSVARSDGQTGPATVGIGIDYSSFAQAFGGDLPDRLTLVALPACALTTPSVPACRTQTPVTFTNDTAGKRLTATVTLPGTAVAATPATATTSSPAPSTATLPPLPPASPAAGSMAIPTPIPTPAPSGSGTAAPGPSGTPAPSPSSSAATGSAPPVSKTTKPKPAKSTTTAPTTAPSTLPASGPSSSAPAVVQAQGVVLATMATPAGSAGSYTATSLSASNGWGEGGNTGAFTYSYPIAVPPALGGSAPSVTLSYDSGAVDGKTAVENSQPSWIGDGWDYSTGYIERSYTSCAKTLYPTGGFPTSADNCFARDSHGNLLPALTISYGAHGGQLIPIDSTNTSFVLPTDDGTQIDVLYGQLSNGTRTGEFYRVRTPDGSVAFFGAENLPDPSAWTAAPGSTVPISGGVDTGSAWDEPVFGDSPASGCQDPTKVTNPQASGSNCMQAWRWNVDFAFDPHANATRYSYLRESNYYGFGPNKTPTWYVRGGVLQEIDYGWQLTDVQTTNGSGTAHQSAAKVQFVTKTRCVDPNFDGPGYANGNGAGQAGCGDTAFDSVPSVNLVDTPFDQYCPSRGTANNQCQPTSPTFWSSRRLASITTQVAVRGAYTNVDHWDLFNQFHPVDVSNAPMWLAAIRHCAAGAVGSNGVCPAAVNSTPNQQVLPDVQFTATAMAQRVPGVTGGPANLPLYSRERIAVIIDELGATTTVGYDTPASYAPLGCTAPPTTAPDWHNTQLCYPEYWTAPGTSTPFTDWFHKYVVTTITTQDNSHPAGTPTPAVTTAYTYGSATSSIYNAPGSNGAGAAWHSNDSELLSDQTARTYDQFRGFAVVTTTTGSATDGTGHPTAQTITTYLRGMDQDPDKKAAAAGSCTSGTLTAASDCTPWLFTDDLSGVATRDDNALAGTVLETQSIDTATGKPYSTTANVPWISPAKAEHIRISPLPALRSRQLGTAQTLTSVPLASGQHRITESRNWYSSLGGRLYYTYALAPRIQETGGPVPGDSTVALCTSIGYASGKDSAGNAKPWMIAYPNSSTTTVTPCGLQTPNYSGWVGQPNTTSSQVLAQSATIFDNATGGAVIAGDATEGDTLTGPQTAPVMQKRATAGFDRYGRTLWTADAAGTTTSTSYTPTNPAAASVELPADVTVTAPAPTAGGTGWVTRTHLDPTRALPLWVTDPNGRTAYATYDALGRTTAGWLSGRTTSTVYPPTIPANTKYSYTVNGYISGGAVTPSVTEADVLREDNTYAVRTTLLDSLGRTRQTQTIPPSDDHGRIVTDTSYDSAGRVSVVSGPLYDSTTAPSSTLWVPPADQTAIPRQTVTLYDGLGRTTDVLTVASAAELWRTHTGYPGADRTDVTPPAGGVHTSTVSDAGGKPAAVYTYHAGVGFGTLDPAHADALTYTYDAIGHPLEVDQVADTAGHSNKWTFGYDLLGRKTTATDPDTGSSTYGYDLAGNLQTTTSAIGTAAQKSLTYTYDLQNRRTAEYAGTTATGTPSATWSYDTVKALTQAQAAANPGSDQMANLGRPAGSTRYSASSAQYIETVGGYDAAGHALSASVAIPTGDGNGALGGKTYTTVNHYTALGQLSSTDLPTGGDLHADTVGFGYNVNGLLVGTSDLFADLLTDSAYSPYGEVQRRVLGDYPSQVVQDTVYDPPTRRVTNSTVSQLAWNAPLDTTAYTYDPAGHLTAAVDVQGKAASINSSTGIVSANVATDAQCYHYDYAGRLDAAWSDTGAVNTAVTTMVNGQIQTVNAPLNRTAYGTVTYAPGSTGGSGNVVTATAATTGGIGQCAGTAPTAGVSGASWQIGGPQPYAQVFSYDGATGNRVSETDYTNATTKSATTTFSYNNPGTAQPHTLKAVTHLNGSGAVTGNDSYQYDGQGNTTSRAVAGQPTQTLTWDAENRLAGDTDGSGAAAAYLYDADGTQLIRRDAATATLYLGGTELHLNLGNGQVTGNRYFGQAGGPTIIESGGAAPKLSYESGNLQGTASTTIDAAPSSADKAITARRAYTPFNTPRGTGQPSLFGTFLDDHTFLGKTTDTTTGLVDIGARKYDPATGRFISIDPVAQFTDPQAVSGYAYAGNDPVNASDPTGLRACIDECGSEADKASVGRAIAANVAQNRKLTASTGSSNPQIQSAILLLRAKLYVLAMHTLPETHGSDGFYSGLDDPKLYAIATNPKIMCEANNFVLTGCDGYRQEWIKNQQATAKTNLVVGTLLLGALPVGMACAAVEVVCAALGRSSLAGDVGWEAAGAATGTATLEGFSLATGNAAIDGLIADGAASLCNNSFTADTRVLMADGTTKPIQDVQVGDTIADAVPGKQGTQHHVVTAIHITDTDTDYTTLGIKDATGDGTITGTSHHIFYDLTTRSWVPAGDLKPGDQLQTPDGTSAVVTTVRSFTQHARTYNLTVDGLHTYYVVVGDTPILVHNALGCGLDPKSLVEGFRANPPGGAIGGNRNIAGATWEIGDVSGSGVAVSGSAARPGTIGMPAEPIFTATRSADSEWKILEQIASQISPDAQGTINLYSELTVCDSCQSVIQQFQKQFPGVTINVTTG